MQNSSGTYPISDELNYYIGMRKSNPNSILVRDSLNAYYYRTDKETFDEEVLSETGEKVKIKRTKEVTKTVIVAYAFDPDKKKQFPYERLKEIVKLLDGANQPDLIIISEVNLSPDGRNKIADIKARIQFFLDEELLTNVIKHKLQPNIIQIMSLKESMEYCDNNGIKSKSLPFLLREKPIAKFFNLKEGQLVVFERLVSTTGNIARKSTYIRRVA